MEITNRTDLFGRRDFVRLGSLGFGAMHVGASPKRELSCILLWQSGGWPHLDTFDMKPNAPREIRGEFREIASNVPGIRVCEHLPNTARIMDKVTVLRSMRSREDNHERATHYLLTGYRPSPEIEFASLGSVLSKFKGPRNGMPPYVAVPGAFPGYGAGFLGSHYNPCSFGELTLPIDVDWTRLSSGAHLGKQMDAKLRAMDAGLDLAATDASCDLVQAAAARRAFDLSAEPDALRERYGRTPVGQGALLARRLVAAGVRFVTVAKGWLNYDTHGDHFNTCKKALLPEFDMAFATLVTDLHDRGMLDTTLVIAMGEFGRTPLINEGAGRDHHCKAWSVAFAGGGIPGGRVLGATDSTGTEVADLPVEPEDLLYTLYTRFGIDPTDEFPACLGRRVRVANGGTMIPGLFP